MYQNSIQETYQSVERDREDRLRENDVDLSQQESFSVLLMGIDTGDLGESNKAVLIP